MTGRACLSRGNFYAHSSYPTRLHFLGSPTFHATASSRLGGTGAETVSNTAAAGYDSRSHRKTRSEPRVPRKPESARQPGANPDRNSKHAQSDPGRRHGDVRNS